MGVQSGVFHTVMLCVFPFRVEKGRFPNELGCVWDDGHEVPQPSASVPTKHLS